MSGGTTNPNQPIRRRLWSRGCDEFANSRSCRASPTAFDADSRCKLLPRSAAQGADPRRSSLLSRRKRKAGRGFCAGGEDCQQFRWSISSHLERIRESEQYVFKHTEHAVFCQLLVLESSHWGPFPNGTIFHKWPQNAYEQTEASPDFPSPDCTPLRRDRQKPEPAYAL